MSLEDKVNKLEERVDRQGERITALEGVVETLKWQALLDQAVSANG